MLNIFYDDTLFFGHTTAINTILYYIIYMLM